MNDIKLKLNKYNECDVLTKDFNNHFDKIDLPIDTQIKIVLNAFSLEEMNEIEGKYYLNEYHWNILGLSYRKINNYEMAEKSYLNAIELKPDYEEPYGNLMSLYILLERWNSYEDIYAKGISKASTTSFIIYQDGRFQFQIGNYDVAYNAALTILQQEKMHSEPAYVLGIKSLIKLSESASIEVRGKFFAESALLLDRALNMFPNSVDLIKIKEANQF